MSLQLEKELQGYRAMAILLKFGHVNNWRAACIAKHHLRDINQILVRASPRLMHNITSVSWHTHHFL
ncbi:hypothetical protein L9G15_24455, partial [Shewanella sp. A3A]|nr:hypothetical protein [Shewanella ferrihydritica]